MRVAGLRKPHLIRPPFLQSGRNVLFRFCSARIQHLRLDIQPPLVIDVEALVDYGAVSLEDARLLIGKDFQARLLLRVVEKVAI